MLTLGTWFHIAFGFILGIVVTIFTIIVAGILKRHSSLGKLASTLIFFSLSVTLIFFIYVSVISGGILVEWQFLGLPAIGDPAVKILEVGYVQTKSGNIYHSICIDCQDKNWEQVEEVSKSQEGMHISSTNNCGTLPFLPFQQREFIDSKSICTSIVWGVTKISYAIDNRGHVYSWIHRFYPGDLVMPWYIENSHYIAVGVASLIFGIIIMLLLVFSNFIMSKIRNDGFRTG